MLFLKGLATSITMVPSRLRHPWDFYSKHIFLTLFFSKCIFTIVTKDSAEKGETALGMRKEIKIPSRPDGVKQAEFLRLWWCLWVVEPDNDHRSSCTREHCNPVWWLCGACAQHCTSEIANCTTNFFCFLGFLEEKLCAVLTSAWNRAHTQREESHSRQVPLSSLTSASLQW